jgi:probable HAF family extracellular repeat protein
MHASVRTLFVAAVVAFALATPAAAQPVFEILDLGPTEQGDWERMVLGAVNNLGQVVGGYRDATSGAWRAMAWDSGTFYPLEGLGGQNEAACDINDAGVVCGSAEKIVENGNGDGVPKSTAETYPAVVWTDSNSDGVADQVHEAGIPFGGGEASCEAINSSGHMTGYCSDPSWVYSAFLWKDQNADHVMDAGEITPLGSLDGSGFSDGADINANDVICGDSAGHPFVWSEDTGMVDLGFLADTETHDYYQGMARGINDAGTVVGRISFHPKVGGMSSGHVAVMWTDSDGDGVADPETITELPRLGGPSSEAYAVNNLGQIVGRSATTAAGDYRAFLYEDGVTYDVNDLILNGAGWTLYSLADISDTGYAIGGADLAGGSSHMFRLQPPGVIAEPLTMTLMLVGMGAAASRMRRRIR